MPNLNRDKSKKDIEIKKSNSPSPHSYETI
jgi:hypothetical protein